VDPKWVVNFMLHAEDAGKPDVVLASLSAITNNDNENFPFIDKIYIVLGCYKTE
jgi:hypothetical protein